MMASAAQWMGTDPGRTCLASESFLLNKHKIFLLRIPSDLAESEMTRDEEEQTDIFSTLDGNHISVFVVASSWKVFKIFTGFLVLLMLWD